MTTLVLEEFETDTAISQTITVASRSYVTAIAPYIYKELNPTGTYTLVIKDSSSNTVATKAVTFADWVANTTISVTTINYAHAFLLFQFDNAIPLNEGEYTIEITPSGYTKNATGLIAWVREYENRTYPPTVSFTENNTFKNPLSYRIWSYRR